MLIKSQLSVAVRNPGYALHRAGNLAREHVADVLDTLRPRAALQKSSVGKEYLVLGLRRSGNHAIINWIEQQLAGAGFHLNNLRLGENPYKYIHDIITGDGLQRDQWIARETQRYRHFQGAEGLSRLRAESRQEFAWKDYLIHSYEDVTAGKIAKSLPEHRRRRFFGRSDTQYNVLILRDPFNLIASRLHSGRLEIDSWHHSILSMWLEHAREYVGEQNLLGGANKVVINFNSWASDSGYRKALAERLGLDFDDAGIDTVTKFGGGSSFDRRGFDGSAQKMDVNNRWRRFVDDPAFRAFFRNPDVFKYSARIFGEMDGIEARLAG